MTNMKNDTKNAIDNDESEYIVKRHKQENKEKKWKKVLATISDVARLSECPLKLSQELSITNPHVSEEKRQKILEAMTLWV